MIITVTVTTVKINVLGFCSSGNSSNGKVNKRRTICEKLVGIGSVMENYAGCGSSCNSHNIGLHRVGYKGGDLHICIAKLAFHAKESPIRTREEVFVLYLHSLTVRPK